MIEIVEGEVAYAGPDYVVIREGGIGYRVMSPALTSGKRESASACTRIRSVRDEGWTLYGFSERIERDLFSLLLEVSGIGPKVG